MPIVVEAKFGATESHAVAGDNTPRSNEIFSGLLEQAEAHKGRPQVGALARTQNAPAP
jgi:hypothetical protein